MGFCRVPISDIDANKRSWVSIVQSRQLGTHKHFYVYSHEAINITLHSCEKAGTASFLGYPVTLLFITKVLNCFIC